ncbi:hypothetical protein BT96DRAFT_1104597 [Gymnopus androsaceus JB14]|uniref:HAT C-terminal dimerisation domain-containing protein n=1 Tax=Gymnopus androsaceus JB14 TaxID=1447944 RepID=A0A6A4HKB0_9AGAR|nr:hypothetical protein BT96DRAFT_1104597 [Gymnopus androsaceus JB14]
MISASSVVVEHSFSRGCILISHLCNCLQANTIRALMCFGDWLQQDFILNAELVEFLRDKGKAKDNAEDNFFIDDNELLL